MIEYFFERYKVIVMKLLYKTKELYVGLLGYVSKEDEDKITANPDEVSNKYIIFERVSQKLDNDRRYELRQDFINYGIDIITGKKYLLWNGNGTFALFKCSLSGYAICKYFPIEQVLTKPKENISGKELRELYASLNKPKEEHDSDRDEKVTDNILNLILETNKKVQKMELSDGDKESIIRKLVALGEEYVNKMIEIRESKDMLMMGSEYSIQMEIIKRLVEIESQIEDKNMREIGSLKRELKIFKRNLDE